MRIICVVGFCSPPPLAHGHAPARAKLGPRVHLPRADAIVSNFADRSKRSFTGQQHGPPDRGWTVTFPTDCYGPHKLALMTLALDAAWEEVETTVRDKECRRNALRTTMALKIMAAVKEGERDLGRLTQLALEAINGY